MQENDELKETERSETRNQVFPSPQEDGAE
jgi:hypothetical protein